MRWVRRVLTFMLAVAILLGGPNALAGEKAEAKAHFERALTLISGEPKDYAGALVEFQSSVRLYPTKSGLYNLGQCYRRLSRYAEALGTFAELEAQFGSALDADFRADIAKEIRTIRKLTAELTLSVSQPGATIRLGGEVIGRSPLQKPLVLPPREHYLEVQMPGFEPVQRTLGLAMGERRTETIQLVPLSAKLMVTTNNVAGAVIQIDGREAGQTPLPAPLALPAGEYRVGISKPGYEPVPLQRAFLQGGETTALTFQLTLPPPERAPQRDTGSGTQQAFAWIGAGLTAATAIAAGVTWYQADSRYEEFTRYDDQVTSGAVRAGDPGAADLDAARESAAEDTDQYSAAAIGLGIASGVFAVATTVLFAVDFTSESAGDHAISTGPGGLTLRF